MNALEPCDSFAGLTIHEPLRPAKDAAIHTPIHGDSKSLPNNRTAKVHIIMYMSEPFARSTSHFYDYLTFTCKTNTLKTTKQESFYRKDCLLHKKIVTLQPI